MVDGWESAVTAVVTQHKQQKHSASECSELVLKTVQ